jgi:hypothetical protein
MDCVVDPLHPSELDRRNNRVADTLKGPGNHTGANYLELIAVSQAGMDGPLFKGIKERRQKHQTQVDDVAVIILFAEITDDV